MPGPADPDAEGGGTRVRRQPLTAEDASTPARPDAPVARSGRGSATVILAVAAAVFAVAAVVLLLLFLSGQKDRDASKEELRVRTTASRFTEAFVALDTKGPVAADDAVINELGTGPIIAQHDQALSALRKLYQAAGAVTARGNITGTYLNQLDAGATQASVIVTVDLVVTGQGPGTPFEHYLNVHLTKVGGAWKVDNVTDVNTQLAAGGGAAPSTTAPSTAPSGSTTTTAVPAPSS